MTELVKKHCEACSGDTPPLKAEEVFRLHQQVPEWDVTSGRKLVRRFEFEDFVEAMDFVNRVAQLAEEEGHHPNIAIDYQARDVHCLDACHRRSVGERLHPRGEDRRALRQRRGRLVPVRPVCQSGRSSGSRSGSEFAGFSPNRCMSSSVR